MKDNLGKLGQIILDPAEVATRPPELGCVGFMTNSGKLVLDLSCPW